MIKERLKRAEDAAKHIKSAEESRELTASDWLDFFYHEQGEWTSWPQLLVLADAAREAIAYSNDPDPVVYRAFAKFWGYWDTLRSHSSPFEDADLPELAKWFEMRRPLLEAEYMRNLNGGGLQFVWFTTNGCHSIAGSVLVEKALSMFQNGIVSRDDHYAAGTMSKLRKHIDGIPCPQHAAWLKRCEACRSADGKPTGNAAEAIPPEPPPRSVLDIQQEEVEPGKLAGPGVQQDRSFQPPFQTDVRRDDRCGRSNSPPQKSNW